MRHLQWKNEVRWRNNHGDESTQCATSQRSSEPDVWPTLLDWDPEEKGYKSGPFIDNDNGRRSSMMTRCKYMCLGLTFEFKHFIRAFFSKPYIWLTCLLMFSVLFTLGVLTFRRFCTHYTNDLKNELLWYAMEIGT